MGFNPRRLLCVFLAAGPMAALPSLALAQQRAGGDGRALDANQQVGSGGVNAAAVQPDFRVRNDMVTGNVAGGRELRINRPYSAPGELQTGLGSDDLFRFRAQSLPSSPVNLSGAQRPINLGGDRSVYRSFSNPSGTIGLSAATPRPDTVIGGTYNPALFRSGLPSPFTQAPAGALSAAPLGDGRILELQASPLLGIRQGQPLTPQPAILRPGQVPTALPVPTDQQEAEPLTPADELREQARRGNRIQYEPLLSTTTDRLGRDQELGRDGQAQFGMASILGRQIQGARADERVNRVGRNLLDRAAMAQQRDEQSPYRDVLEAVQDPQQREALPGQPRDPNARPILDVPDDERMRRVEQQRTEAIRRAFGDRQGEAAEGETGQPAAGPTGSVAELLERLNYDLPPMQTLAGQRESRINGMLRQAETELQSGQYFNAERLYRQVVQQAPDQPLAHVGLVHAQLGAGMIRSAAVNLRMLFEDHPELIAARYDAKLLPNEDRLKWVRAELDKMLESPDSSSEPALMMAYLGYQVNSPQLVRYGLATAESRNPRDPLVPVLRAIWLDPSRGASGAANPSAAPGGPESSPQAAPADQR